MIEMPSPWSYCSVPPGPEIGSISPAGTPGLLIARRRVADGPVGAIEQERRLP